MLLAESKVFAEYAKTPKEGVYDFYRCYKCGRVFTREGELKAFGEDGVKAVCGCGSQKYSPAWPIWFDWLKPSVIKYTIKLLLARGLAPWAEKKAQWLLPYLEWACSIRYPKVKE